MVVAFFDSIHNEEKYRQPRGGRHVNGIDQALVAFQYKEFKEDGPSFAEMLGGAWNIPKCSTVTKQKNKEFKEDGPSIMAVLGGEGKIPKYSTGTEQKSRNPLIETPLQVWILLTGINGMQRGLRMV